MYMLLESSVLIRMRVMDLAFKIIYSLDMNSLKVVSNHVIIFFVVELHVYVNESECESSARVSKEVTCYIAIPFIVCVVYDNKCFC